MRAASAACTTKQMLSCEDDCEIITIFACTEALAAKMRAAMSGTPMMPGPAIGDHGNIARRGDSFHALRRGPDRLRDFRSGQLRLETVANPYRNAAFDDRAQRHRMQHFCAKEGQFARLGVGNFIERGGVGNHARVGGQHAVYIRPDNDFAGVESRAQNRRGIIRTASAERGGNSFGRCGDVSGNDRNSSGFEQRQQSWPAFLSASVQTAAGRRRALRP